ncbi:S-layer homology domain-containing protein [Collinsella sp. D33t1_170424_A12]|uniref:S-layer homology domain-containing protein n=1 Tax=Collinsella sp. D33t1_170424_A12 TaxID=2787135 RepID=UPI0018973605|nr:S-layer homology domain-containing protein [Collinsella sp. D33t1_170424_A12]
MRRRFSQAVLWIAVALCICALPLAANGASWGGTVLSKGLVYDDAYGVVNGNALMYKSINDSDGQAAAELDLVASDGSVLFKTGFTFDEWGFISPHSSYRYIPANKYGGSNAAHSSGFETCMGGLIVVDTTTDKICYVNNKGTIITKDHDAIVAIPSGERILTARAENGALSFSLLDTNGTLIDSAHGFEGMGTFYNMAYRDGIVSISVSNTYDGTITIENDTIVLHEDLRIDPGGPATVIEQSGYKVEITGDGDAVFTRPDGTVKTIEGDFNYVRVAWMHNGIDVGITAGGSRSGSLDSPERFFILDGTEIFNGKDYNQVTKLENEDAYLCFQMIENPQSHESTYRYCIDHLNTGAIQELPYLRDIHYDVVGSYIAEKQSDPADATYGGGYSYTTKIIDANGRTIKSYKPSEHWTLSIAPIEHPTTDEAIYIFADARYVLKEEQAKDGFFTECGKTRYLSKDLTTLKEFDGSLSVYLDIEIEGESVFPLSLNSEHAWTPSVLYDRDLEPVTYHGMQRVIANSAAERGGLAYVTDGKGRYGALDASGNPVIPIEFEAICDAGENLDDSTILVKRDGRWYFMDVTGRGPQPQAPSFSDVVAGETPHAEHIAWLAASGVSKGWGNGDGTSSFRPYAEVARCDMAAFLYRMAGEPAFEPTAGQRAAFSDVDGGTPHAREVWWLAAQGISAGWDEADGTRTFRPYETVKRCDMAAFLNRLVKNAGKPAGAGSPFTDVVDTTPHRAAVLWLASNEVSKGWTEPDGAMTFRPHETVKRADMAAFLHRMDEKGLMGES